MIGEYAAVITGGFLGSAHCIGMCGGFAAAISAADRPFWPIFARQMVYNSGRVFTYAFLGGLAGWSGVFLSQYRIGSFNPQQLFSVFAGVTMLLVGLSTLGVVRMPAGYGRAFATLVAPLYGYFLNARGWWGYFAAGIANGFLPCGLVYSFLALAAAQQGPVPGMALMACFGLSTMPAMVTIGCGTKLLTHSVRMRVYRVAAVLVIVLGVVTVWRGWPSAGPCCEQRQARLYEGDGGREANAEWARL